MGFRKQRLCHLGMGLFLHVCVTSFGSICFRLLPALFVTCVGTRSVVAVRPWKWHKDASEKFSCSLVSVAASAFKRSLINSG